MILGKLLSFLLRRFPFVKGQVKLLERLPQVIPPEHDGLVLARVNGIEVRVDPNDFNGRMAYYFGMADPRLAFLMKKIVRPGDCVLDVGANIGMFSVLMAELVGSSGKVHSFEPNPKLMERLKEALRNASYDQVILHSSALGEVEGQFKLTVPIGHSGKGSFLGNGNRESAEVITCEVKCLDSFASEFEFGIAFAKIDVEGVEAQVLAGGEAILRNHPPKAILFEYLRGAVPFNESEVVVRLRGMGYRIYGLHTGWRAIALREVAGLDGPEGSDFLAIHKAYRPADFSLEVVVS